MNGEIKSSHDVSFKNELKAARERLIRAQEIIRPMDPRWAAIDGAVEMIESMIINNHL